MVDVIWSMERGQGPMVALALHDGHAVRQEVARHMVLEESVRFREEDPFTGSWTTVAPTRVVASRSRFEVDLNRPRETSIYRTPEEAWGLRVWSDTLPDEVVARTLEAYDAFYAELDDLFSELAERYGRFLILDLHSYNHRRPGPEKPPEDPLANPQINIGTGTMVDRDRWARVIDRFMLDLSSCEFPGSALDVRENIRFRGGACAAWTHRRFPETACVLSVEVKKFFMDEWTGEVDHDLHEAIRLALAAAVPGAVEELRR